MADSIVTSTVKVNDGDIFVKEYTIQNGARVYTNTFKISFANGKIETLEEKWESQQII